MKLYYLWLIVAVVMLFIQAMCDLALPDYMSDIVNDGVMGGSVPIIAKYGLKMILTITEWKSILRQMLRLRFREICEKTCIKRWNCSQMPNLINSLPRHL